MKTKINRVLLLYIIITTFYVFFSHFIFFSSKININTGYLVISVAFFIYTFIINYKDISLDKCDCWLVMYILYLLISTLTWDLNSEGIKYIIFFITINLIAWSMKCDTKWIKTIINMMTFCTLIHCIFIILHAIFPEVILQLDKSLLNSSAWKVIEMGTNNNYYSGITLGAASAGLFSTILVGIVICKIISNKKIDFKNTIFLSIGLIALLLSQKRAFLVAIIISSIVIIYVANKIKGKAAKLIKRFFVFAIISILLFGIASFIPQTRNVINRFIDNDNMLSGRETMYEEMITWFKENMYFGIGPGTAEQEFGYGGHNIYLQMLAECGIVGASIYFIYLLKLCATNVKIAIKGKNADYRILFTIFMQTVLVIYGITGNPIYDYSYLVIFTYILIIPRSIKKELSSIEKSECNNTSV